MSPLEKKDVLVVDDDEAIRNLIRIAMIRAGLTCDTASDGLEALARVSSSAQYSVVLTDLMMPRLDGASFVEELAALDRSSNERPVVLIMTAFPDGERLPVVGDLVHAVIRKPFDVEDLAELVHTCIEMRRSLAPGTSA